MRRLGCGLKGGSRRHKQLTLLDLLLDAFKCPFGRLAPDVASGTAGQDVDIEAVAEPGTQNAPARANVFDWRDEVSDCLRLVRTWAREQSRDLRRRLADSFRNFVVLRAAMFE